MTSNLLPIPRFTLRSTSAAILLAVSMVSAPGEEELKEHVFEDIGVKATFPANWHIRKDSEEGVIVYQVTPENPVNHQGDFRIGFTLTFTPEVPSRTGIDPSKYAADLLSFTVEDGNTVSQNEEPPFSIFRVEYSVDGDAGSADIVDIATANDATGTLYFVAWQNPSSESAQVGPLREKILSSFVFDAKPGNSD